MREVKGQTVAVDSDVDSLSAEDVFISQLESIDFLLPLKPEARTAPLAEVP